MIDRLLNLSWSLSPNSRSTNNKNDTKSLTLKQLIQVNESLIDSVLYHDGKNNNFESPLNKDANLTFTDIEDILQDNDDDNYEDKRKKLSYKILKRVLLSSNKNNDNDNNNEQELEICQSILLSKNISKSKSDTVLEKELEKEECSILMIFQYLLRLSTVKHTSSSSSSSSSVYTLYATLSNIVNVTYPLILVISSTSPSTLTPTASKGGSSRSYSAELSDAMLDATFSNIREEHTINKDNDNYSANIQPLLSNCLQMIQQTIETIVQTTVADSRQKDTFITSEWIVTIVEFSCRILPRLLSFVHDENICNNTTSNIMIQCILDTIHQVSLSILNALCYYNSNNNEKNNSKNNSTNNKNNSGPLLMNGRTSTLLKIVTSLLVPTLIEFDTSSSVVVVAGDDVNDSTSSSHNTRMLLLWNFVHDLMLTDCCDDDIDEKEEIMKSTNDEFEIITTRRKCRTWESTAPSVASAVLCIIVKCISSLLLPFKQASNDSDKACTTIKLAQHPVFWDFIKKSLHSEATLSVDSRGMKGGGAFVARTNDNPYNDDSDMENENVGQLVRRRSIHVLRLLIEKEYDVVSGNNISSNTVPQLKQLQSKIIIWKKYIICFEALEMEEEAHLVDQVWDTVIELCAACHSETISSDSNNKDIEDEMSLPSMSWDMLGSLFARVLLSDSPTLRKIGLFRLLTGRAGISVNDDDKITNQEKTIKNDKKGKKKNKKLKVKSVESSPISIVSPSFILQILVPSFDSLATSGFNFVDPLDGKTTNYDLEELIGPFISKYCKSLMKTPTKLEDFIKRMLSADFLASVRVKTLVLVLKSVSNIWSNDQIVPSLHNRVSLTSSTISEAVQSFYKLFFTGSVVFDYRISLLLHFATILSHSEQTDENNKPEPMLILDTLILYVTTDEILKESEKNESQDKALKQWLQNTYDAKFLVTVTSSCAASFVSGQLIAFENDNKRSTSTLVLTTIREREVGSSISKLCALVGDLGLNSASSMLWPAISKGLSNISNNTDLSIPSYAAHQAVRALILLESGCKETILNGIGHGDLLADKNGNMVPPPPTIEHLLSCAVNFLLHQLKRVSVCDANIGVGDECDDNQAAKSQIAMIGTGSYYPNHFAMIINQLVALKRAYPSSVIMSKAIYELLSMSLKDLTNGNKSHEIKIDSIEENILLVKTLCLLLGTLSFASEEMLMQLGKETFFFESCSMLLKAKFDIPNTISTEHGLKGWQIKAMRSIFQYAKWGSLSLLLPETFGNSSLEAAKIYGFHEEIIDTALDSINATPAKGILALFQCVITAAKNSFVSNSSENEKYAVKSYVKNMTKIIEALFTIMDDTSHNATRAYMLQCTCSLLFRPERLEEEYRVFKLCQEDGMDLNNITLPILSAFRKMINLAGTSKPYISKYALSYISVAWLGNNGLSAIPYREDIAKLLIHKEAKLDIATSHKEGLVKDDDIQEEGGFAVLPKNTPDTSCGRGFLLTFISSLSNVDDGLPLDVKRKICYYLILYLLDAVCLQDITGVMVTGATVYCQILRAWQSLCLLSRFVTSDIAEMVCHRVFKAMSQTLHGQIRYFVEIFTIQCARLHPNIFGKILVQEIKKVDTSPQYVCSMMIVAGNLTVGKFAKDFIDCPSLDLDIKEIIASIVPWLGSTQSFCRAIAQLLVHKLVPLSFPSIRNGNDKGMQDKHSDWFFVKSTWTYLNENSEMKKLRNKQLRFFESYEADSVCTPEGIFGFEIDEADEANPPYLVDLLKRCLLDIGNENAAQNLEWAQLEDLLNNINLSNDEIESNSLDDQLNLQRKILPVDTLNLTLENYRQQKRRNAAGRNRQSLIVCASLIDKVTNLGGITRTAEIFAADKVIVPDIQVRKMDNFRSISVGAGEWVNIEECKEPQLLNWLKRYKQEGYTIVGVEQTENSKCLSNVRFEGKSILLLGKEKEGIPQQFLNIVDQCVEIPQLGVIRSLNVHVSASIVMWEYTKQMMMHS